MRTYTEVKQCYTVEGVEITKNLTEIAKTNTDMRELEIYNRRFSLAYIPAMDITVCFEYWARIGNQLTSDYAICNECGQRYVDYVCGILEDTDTVAYLIKSIKKYIDTVKEPWNNEQSN